MQRIITIFLTIVSLVIISGCFGNKEKNKPIEELKVISKQSGIFLEKINDKQIKIINSDNEIVYYFESHVKNNVDELTSNSYIYYEYYINKDGEETIVNIMQPKITEGKFISFNNEVLILKNDNGEEELYNVNKNIMEDVKGILKNDDIKIIYVSYKNERDMVEKIERIIKKDDSQYSISPSVQKKITINKDGKQEEKQGFLYKTKFNYKLYVLQDYIVDEAKSNDSYLYLFSRKIQNHTMIIKKINKNTNIEEMKKKLVSNNENLTINPYQSNIDLFKKAYFYVNINDGNSIQTIIVMDLKGSTYEITINITAGFETDMSDFIAMIKSVH